MNERIKELEKQSVYYNEDEEIWETDLKKFAELIVEECIDVVEGDDGASHVRELLSKHFGVEE